MLDPWPFATVPDAARARIWAGRHERLTQLTGLLSRWNRRRASEICVLWADFGQGKTHSLLFLQNRLSEERDYIVHYAQLPPLASGSPFVAIYRQLMREFPLETLDEVVFRHFERSPMAIFRDGHPTDRLICQLLWLVATKAPGHDTAARWLRADAVGSRGAYIRPLPPRPVCPPGLPGISVYLPADISRPENQGREGRVVRTSTSRLPTHAPG